MPDEIGIPYIIFNIRAVEYEFYIMVAVNANITFTDYMTDCVKLFEMKNKPVHCVWSPAKSKHKRLLFTISEWKENHE